MDKSNDLRKQLVDQVDELVDRIVEKGISVHAYCDGTPRRGTWVVLERDGNVGSLQYDRLDGYKVIFATKPSRELGSGLIVTRPDGGDVVTVEDVLEAVETAVGDRYKNFTRVEQPNHGWDHFAWARKGDRLALVASPAGADD